MWTCPWGWFEDGCPTHCVGWYCTGCLGQLYWKACCCIQASPTDWIWAQQWEVSGESSPGPGVKTVVGGQQRCIELLNDHRGQSRGGRKMLNVIVCSTCVGPFRGWSRWECSIYHIILKSCGHLHQGEVNTTIHTLKLSYGQFFIYLFFPLLLSVKVGPHLSEKFKQDWLVPGWCQCHCCLSQQLQFWDT